MSLSKFIDLELEQQFQEQYRNTDQLHRLKVKLNLTLEFQPAVNSAGIDPDARHDANLDISERYPIEKLVNENGISLEVTGKVGPFAIRVSKWNFDVTDLDKGTYSEILCGFGFAVDNKKPEYLPESNTLVDPSIRDGNSWVVTDKKGTNYVFDQNGNAKWQLSMAESIQGREMSLVDTAFGKEKTTDDTGLMFISIQVFVKSVLWRGCKPADEGNAPKPILARIGYGEGCTTYSRPSNYKFAKMSQIWTIPFRCYTDNVFQPMQAPVSAATILSAKDIVAETPIKAEQRNEFRASLAPVVKTEQELAIEALRLQLAAEESPEVKRQKMMEGKIPLSGNFCIPKPK
jgi:hypothetical protein